eukprot:5840083-Lingulodinium_polyedra.AAC.1
MDMVRCHLALAFLLPGQIFDRARKICCHAIAPQSQESRPNASPHVRAQGARGLLQTYYVSRPRLSHAQGWDLGGLV